MTSDGFVLHERFSHHIQLVAIIDQDLLRFLVAAIDNVANFLVDPLRGLRRVNCLRLTSGAAQERLLTVSVVLQWAELFRQSPTSDHVASQARRALNIVRRTGGDTIDTQR